MRHFDESCLGSVAALQPIEIKALREQLNVSQPVFARYLNTSVSTVQKWETGAKRPSGMSLKLLSVVQKHGLKSYCSYPAGWRLRLSGLQVTSAETVGRIRRSRHPAETGATWQDGWPRFSGSYCLSAATFIDCVTESCAALHLPDDIR